MAIRTMAFLAITSCLSFQAMAQTTLYWTGTRNNDMWSTSPGHKNWSLNDPFAGPAQPFATGDNVVFSQSAITAMEGFATINGPFTAGSVQITNDSGLFTFAGTALTASSFSVNGGGNINITNTSTNVTGSFDVSNGSEATLTGTLSAGSISATGSFTQGAGATQGNTDGSGTIILGADSRIADATPITLGGGTLRTNGFDEGTSTTAGLGALTLTANSILDFSSTGGLLHFSGFIPGTSTLQIWNWDSSDQLYFSPQLDEAQLAQIVFYSDNGLSLLGNAGIGSSGIVPVPEPGTIFGAIALVGLVSWRERRRIGAVLQSLR